MSEALISRKKALELGREYFFTGKPCPKGNISKRRVSDYKCVCKDCRQAVRDRVKKWNESNPGRMLERVSRWKKSNPERAKANSRASHKKCAKKESAYAKKYYRENRDQVLLVCQSYRDRFPDRRRDSIKSWSQRNKAVVAKNASNRRARVCNAIAPWFSELDEFVLQEAYDLLPRREKETGFPWHVDHMIPIACDTASGLHCANNIQVIPAHLNSRKGNRLRFTEPLEWLKEA